MALIRFVDGHDKRVSPETGRKIWDILQGTVEANEKEADLAAKVNKIYLNWINAPDDYIERYFDVIARSVVSSWMVATVGAEGYRRHQAATPFARRPDSSQVANYEFCRRWGLIDDWGLVTAKGQLYV